MRQAVRRLVGRETDNLIVDQIVRVILHLANPDSHARPVPFVRGMDAPADILEFFEHGRRLNPVLLEECRRFLRADAERAGMFHSAPALATALVAAAYPSRVEFPDGRSPVAEFAAWFASAEEPFGGLLPLGGAGLPELAADLCNARSFDDAAAAAAHAEYGALYLRTRSAAEQGRMLSCWRNDGAFVRFMRSPRLSAPPSAILNVGRAEAAHLAEALGPGTDVALCARAIGIESLTRGAGLHADEAWNALWSKLPLVFPYYSFRSRLESWWSKSLRPWKRQNATETGVQLEPDEESDGRAGAPSDESAEEKEELEGLRIFREGYRVVRRTFFAADFEHDRLRMLLDRLWDEHLAGTLDMGAIASDFGVTHATVRTYHRRLKLRMWTYKRARQDRQPAWGTRIELDEMHEPGIERVAAMGLAVPSEETGLWSVLAHGWLQPQVEPARKDRWTPEDVARELEIFALGSLPDAVRRTPGAAPLVRLLQSPARGPREWCAACIAAWRAVEDLECVVPVWLAVFVYRLSLESVLEQLKPTRSAEDSVRALYGAMTRPGHDCLRTPPGSGL